MLFFEIYEVGLRKIARLLSNAVLFLVLQDGLRFSETLLERVEFERWRVEMFTSTGLLELVNFCRIIHQCCETIKWSQNPSVIILPCLCNRETVGHEM